MVKFGSNCYVVISLTPPSNYQIKTKNMDRDYIRLPDIENQWNAYEASKEALLAGGLDEGRYTLFVNKRMFQFKILDTLAEAYNYAKRGYDNCLLASDQSS